MGYTTKFEGSFSLSPALTGDQTRYLRRFSQTRRMKRDPSKLDPDPIREAVGLPPEVEGDFYVGSSASFGEDYNHPSVVKLNYPPDSQPGLWCQWIPTEDGTELEWDTGEKFYDYIEWLQYLIENFLTPWGIKVNGTVIWSGEDLDDVGAIEVKDSVVNPRGVVCGNTDEDKVEAAIEFLKERGFGVHSEVLINPDSSEEAVNGQPD